MHSDDATSLNPAVTAVVATHNRPELVRLTIASILDQSYEGPLECIIVFDRAEPDYSLEDLAEGHGPLRTIRITRNERTAGLAGARNSGVMMATGELVAFCDDDDEWLAGKLNAQVRTFDDPKVLTSVTGIRIVYDDHETVRVPSASTIDLADLTRRRVMEAHPSSVVTRRSALLGDIGLVDESIPGSYGEDFDWILRAARVGTIAAVQQPLVKVRWGQSLFSRNWKMIIDAIDFLIAKHPELRSDRKGLARLNGRRSFALAALGQRSAALRNSWGTLKLSAAERRAYLAILVALRLVSAERLMRMAHKRGLGI
jgi:glycosyltransferase involved in cell wall biosynthesis